MQGTGVGRNHVARYCCATRRKTRDCDQPVVPADEVERQLAEFIQGFAPEPSVREEILRRLAEDAGTPESSETTKRRAALEERLRRMRDLYELGDLKRPEYLARRDTLNAELAALAPEPIPDFDQARKVLEDFKVFWTAETDPDAKREFLSLIFQGVWLDERRVVAVQPKPSFLAFFEDRAGEAPADMGGKVRERRGSNPRLLPRGSRLGSSSRFGQSRRRENYAGVVIGGCVSGRSVRSRSCETSTSTLAEPECKQVVVIGVTS